MSDEAAPPALLVVLLLAILALMGLEVWDAVDGDLDR